MKINKIDLRAWRRRYDALQKSNGGTCLDCQRIVQECECIREYAVQILKEITDNVDNLERYKEMKGLRLELKSQRLKIKNSKSVEEVQQIEEKILEIAKEYKSHLEQLEGLNE